MLPSLEEMIGFSVAGAFRTARSVMRVSGEMFQFSVKARRFFQKGRMTDAVVPRRFRGPAVVEYVVGHGRQHYNIRATLSNEDGHRNSFKDRRKIKFALNHCAANTRFYNHIESQDFLEIVLQDWLDDASAQESANGRNVGRKIVLRSARCVLQKARPYKRTKAFGPRTTVPSTKLIPAILPWPFLRT